MDLYQMLEVEKTATQAEIKKAYKRKAAKMHPDKGGSEEEFKKLNEAFQVLSVSSSREHYDRTGQGPEKKHIDQVGQEFMGAFSVIIDKHGIENLHKVDIVQEMSALFDQAIRNFRIEKTKLKVEFEDYSRS